MSTKRQSSLTTNNKASKLQRTTHIARNQFTCINPLCNKTFATKKQFSLHFFKSTCSQAFKSTNKTTVQHNYCNSQTTKQSSIKKTAALETDEENNGINFEYMNPSSDESTFQNYYPDSSTDEDSNEDDDSLSGEEENTNDNILHNHTTTIMLPDNANWTGYCTPFTIDMLAETELLKILDDANAPHYLFKEIMEWACKFYNKKYNFKPSSYNCKNILLKMRKNGKVWTIAYQNKYQCNLKRMD